MALTAHEKELVFGTWTDVTKDINAAGLLVFKQFFADNPTYQQYFSFRNVPTWEELEKDKRLKAHAANVMYYLDMMMKNLNDTEVFVEMVEKLARSHVRRKLNVQHFENLKKSIVTVLVSALGPQRMNAEAIAAWAKAYSVITDVMQATLDKAEQA